MVETLRGLSTELSAAQLGITLTTLIVGFLAEPALGGLLEPVLTGVGLPEGAIAPIAVTVGIALATFLGIFVYVVFRHSHNSVDTISLARRAFSLAAPSEYAIDDGCVRSAARVASRCRASSRGRASSSINCWRFETQGTCA